MEDSVDWLPGWISVVVNITDLSFSYSYSERRDELEHRYRDYVDIWVDTSADYGEGVFLSVNSDGQPSFTSRCRSDIMRIFIKTSGTKLPHMI